MVRQRHLIATTLTVLLVAVLYLSPAYAHPNHIHGTSAGGPHFVKVKAGTPVTVLGMSKPGNRPCPDCPIDAVVQLPNGDVVIVAPNAINYQTQTMRKDWNYASGPYTPAELEDFRWLPGTGGAALLPLLGAAMLIGGGLLTHRVFTMKRYAA